MDEAKFLLQCIIEASDCIEKGSRFGISGRENIEKYENCIAILLNRYRYKQQTIKEHILELKVSEYFYKNKILGIDPLIY